MKCTLQMYITFIILSIVIISANIYVYHNTYFMFLSLGYVCYCDGEPESILIINVMGVVVQCTRL